MQTREKKTLVQLTALGKEQVNQFTDKVIGGYFLASVDERDYTSLYLQGNLAGDICFEIPYCGRLSNFIIQVSNAITLAGKIGVQTIYISGTIPDGFYQFWTVGMAKIPGEVRVIEQRPPTSRIVLSSLFFHVRRGNRSLFSDGLSMRETLQRCYSQNFNAYEQAPVKLVVKVHIRSGDVFKGRDVHRDYGQPPLAFYRLVINRLRPSFIVLVFEDRSNPVIEPLESWLKEIKIRFTSRVRSLAEDLTELSTAEYLVISRGTFALAPIICSVTIKHIFCFCHSLERDDYMKLPVAEFLAESSTPAFRRVTEVHDTTQEYFRGVCHSNWTNSRDQRALMTTYPESKLTIREFA
jgi:hypothetical protein